MYKWVKATHKWADGCITVDEPFMVSARESDQSIREIISERAGTYNYEDHYRGFTYEFCECPKKPGRYTSKEIIEILSSFKEFRIDADGVVETLHVGDDRWSCPTSYAHGTFTRDLVELINEHLCPSEDEGK